MDRDLIIIRGVPGSGKDTVASLFSNAIVCIADDWYDEVLGEYKWSPANGAKAHAWCRSKAENAMENDHPLVIIANTNTVPKEWKAYEELANKYSYRVHHIIVENRHGGENTHGVPEDTLVKMEKRLRDSIQLK